MLHKVKYFHHNMRKAIKYNNKGNRVKNSAVEQIKILQYSLLRQLPGPQQ